MRTKQAFHYIFLALLIASGTSAIAGEACPAGAMIALQSQVFANKLITDSKVEMVNCEKSNQVLAGKSTYVVLHLLQRTNGDYSAVLSLYKADGFSLASAPELVRRELSSEIFPFKLNGQKRLLALADVNNDGKEEILMNLAVGGESTGLLVFSASKNEFQQLKMNVKGSVEVAEDNVDMIMSFAGREIELTSTTAGLSALIAKSKSSGKISVVAANIQVISENKEKK